jgi:hypothetical protein
MVWTPGDDARRHAVDCASAMGYYERYPVPVAAALWCAVPADRIQWVLDTASEVARGIFRHSEIPCLEPKCRALHEAIDKGGLPVYRENGGAVRDHVAPERRHVSRDELRAFIKAQRLDMPATLFDEVERATHPDITKDAYLALKAELEKARAELRQAEKWGHGIVAERDTLQLERDQLRGMLDKLSTPNPKAETTYLNIIGGLLDLMLGTTPNGNRQSVYESQSAIISALLAHHGGKQGISDRTLEEKFAAAKRSLKAAFP